MISIFQGMLTHWTKKIIVEEGHTVAQLVHILWVLTPPYPAPKNGVPCYNFEPYPFFPTEFVKSLLTWIIIGYKYIEFKLSPFYFDVFLGLIE